MERHRNCWERAISAPYNPFVPSWEDDDRNEICNPHQPRPASPVHRFSHSTASRDLSSSASSSTPISINSPRYSHASSKHCKYPKPFYYPPYSSLLRITPIPLHWIVSGYRWLIHPNAVYLSSRFFLLYCWMGYRLCRVRLHCFPYSPLLLVLAPRRGIVRRLNC